MNQSTYQIAKDLGVQVAPIGPAWDIAQSLEPNISLYWPDGRHPTVTGSYLAACTIYLILMNDQKACPAIYPGVISPNDITVVRKASLQAISGVP